jgi:tetratricopeptide (TPR) repeat protein
LRVNPNHLKARLLVAQVLLEQNRLEEAIADLEEAYRYGEEQARYALVHGLLTRAEMLEQAADDDAALAIYERVLVVSPREAVAQEHRTQILRRRAQAALKAGDLPLAQQSYEQAGDLAEAKQVAKRTAAKALEQAAAKAQSHEKREEWDQAIAIYQQLMSDDPAEPRWHDAIARVKAELRLSQWYLHSKSATQQGDWPRAIALLADIERVKPRYKDTAQLRGQAQEALNKEIRAREQREDWAGALALYTELAERMPQEAHWQREITRLTGARELSEQYANGLVALRKRNWDEAFDALSAVVRARPGYKDAAKLLQRAERGQQGKRRWLQLPAWGWAIVILAVLGLSVGGYYIRPWYFPISAEEYYNRGLSRVSSRSYDLAIADFTQAIALQADYADAYYQRGHTYWLKDDNQRAVDDLTQSIKINPNKVESYTTRASAYRALNQFDLALADQTLLIEKLGCQSCYADRAEIYVAKGDFPRASEDYTTAIGLDPNNSALYLARGKVWVQKGHRDQAIADFRKVLEISGYQTEKDEAQKQLDALGTK